MKRAPYRLYLIFMDGCEMCATVKPHVQSWAAAHSLLRYIEADITKVEWKAKAWSPSEVPTVILLRPDGRVFYKQGPWATDEETIHADLGDWARRVTGGAKEVS